MGSVQIKSVPIKFLGMQKMLDLNFSLLPPNLTNEGKCWQLWIKEILVNMKIKKKKTVQAQDARQCNCNHHINKLFVISKCIEEYYKYQEVSLSIPSEAFLHDMIKTSSSAKSYSGIRSEDLIRQYCQFVMTKVSDIKVMMSIFRWNFVPMMLPVDLRFARNGSGFISMKIPTCINIRHT